MVVDNEKKTRSECVCSYSCARPGGLFVNDGGKVSFGFTARPRCRRGMQVREREMGRFFRVVTITEDVALWRRWR
jgi:hypothetical protein